MKASAPSLFDDLTFLPEIEGLDLRRFEPGRYDAEATALAHEQWRKVTERDGWFHFRGWWSSDYERRTETERHTFQVLRCDLRCDWHRLHERGETCQCVGDLLYRHVCDCGWQGDPQVHENAAAEAWLDHAWPGWRDLEPIPAKLRKPEMTNAEKAKHAAWLEQHQPEAFRGRGAPIRTYRSPMATRHVPGGSPFGGYDVAAAVNS